MAVLFIDHGTRRGEGSASRPGRSLHPRKTRYPLYRRLGGPQGRSGQVRKISPSTGIRSPDRPARSQSLYRLSYPAQVGIIAQYKYTYIVTVICVYDQLRTEGRVWGFNPPKFRWPAKIVPNSTRL